MPVLSLWGLWAQDSGGRLDSAKVISKILIFNTPYLRKIQTSLTWRVGQIYCCIEQNVKDVYSKHKSFYTKVI